MADKPTFVVAHDFSPCADAALKLAVDDLAVRGGGVAVLAHSYAVMPVPAAVDVAGAGGGIVTLERAVATEAGRKLEAVASTARAAAQAKGVTLEVAVCQDGPAEGVVAIAKQKSAERIYVGTHGRTGLSHLLLGSVAERVARLATTPVVVVKTP